MCAEFADGIPLVGIFLLGSSFILLQYGQFYRPPLYDADTNNCSKLHPKDPHLTHAVVLTGPKTNHRTGEVGFHIVNSWENWGHRTIIDKNEHPGVVDHGLGNIPADALLFNALKFWQPGQTAVNNPRRFRDEPDDSYVTDSFNMNMYYYA